MGRRLLLGMLLLALAGCARVGGEPFQQSVNRALPLGEQALGQTFRPATSAVRGVDLLVATFGGQPDADASLTVRLLDGDAELARVEVPGAGLADNAWVAAPFDEPVQAPDVATIEVTWDGQAQVGLWANVPPVQGEDDRLVNDPYPGGELLVDGERAAGDLAFRVRGSGGAVRLPRALAGIGAGALRGLADRPLFGVGWALLLLGSVGLATYGFRHRGPHEQQRRDEEGRAAEPGELADEPR